MTKLRKFLHLSPKERRLLVKALLVLVAVRLALWLLRFPTQKRLLSRLNQAPLRLTGGEASSDQIAWAVSAASLYVPRATCLTQALAAQVLLNGAGVPARLRIGVARDGEGRFQAHAWVEHGGKVVIGGCDLASYTPFQSISGLGVHAEEALSPAIGIQ
jgi:hypothetical protein